MIMLTACTNKLSVTHEEGEDYAALVMEELDEEKQGYLEVSLCVSYLRPSNSRHVRE